MRDSNPLVDLQSLVRKHAPPIVKNLPESVRIRFEQYLRRTLHIARIENFIRQHGTFKGFDLIDEMLEEADISFLVSSRELERIPSFGSVVCVCNHPLGGLDGLIALRAIGTVRSDVVVVANEFLGALPGLRQFLLPVDVFGGKARRDQIAAISRALEEEKAVVFFPAGEVARGTLRGVRDGRWNKGAVRLAQAHAAPILPLHMEGRNSLWFYILSVLSKKLSTLLLPRELFLQKGKSIRVRIGELIPADSIRGIRSAQAITLVRKQVESLPLGRKGPFLTQSGIALPVERRLLRKEIGMCQELGSPSPGKRVFLADAQMAPAIVREIARLREVTFRYVGEGTGRRLDLDRYDASYHHLFVWDETRLEIAGAYRFGFGAEIMRKQGIDGLYTRSLFSFVPELVTMIPSAVEFGRSFVQRQYWNSNVLEYLWAAIGAVLTQRGGMRYLLGPVSISRIYPADAQAAIVHVYQKWYGADQQLASALNPYTIPRELRRQLREYFTGKDAAEDLNRLKLRLRAQGKSIPMLFRQYTELCSGQGVRIHDFGVDPQFGSCLDAFLVLDLAYLEESKRVRYIGRYKDTLRYACPGNAHHAVTPDGYPVAESSSEDAVVVGERLQQVL